MRGGRTQLARPSPTGAAAGWSRSRRWGPPRPWSPWCRPRAPVSSSAARRSAPRLGGRRAAIVLALAGQRALPAVEEAVVKYWPTVANGCRGSRGRLLA
ncbi:hypothetical protein ID867_24515 [Streptomyces parvulus]|nr:hypothetical protein [Streptomyces parvulus]